MSDIGKHIGENLKAHRQRNGLSMIDLATRMCLLGDNDVTAGMIGTWERGQRNMLASHLQYAAKALNCSVISLYEADVTPSQRLQHELSHLSDRQKQTLLYASTEWEGNVHALLEWIRMYVSIPRSMRTDVAGLAINQYSHLIKDGMHPVLDVDLKLLQQECDRIERCEHGIEKEDV